MAIGEALIVAGLGGSITAIADWGRHGYRELDTTRTLRIVISSGLALTLGIQVTFSSFFMRILGLHIWRLAWH